MFNEEECISNCIEEKMEDCIEKCNEAKKKAEAKPKISETNGMAEDWINKHNVITRIIALVVVGVFIYAFMVPLPLGYVETVSYLLLFIMLIITFGLNSLKVIGNLIDKWKR